MARPELATKIDALMGGLAADLARLARLPSGPGCAGPPRRLVPRAHDLLVELLRAAGVQSIRDVCRPDGNPQLTGSIRPPTPEAPTVLLYADYDMRVPGEPPTPGPAPAPLLVHLGTLRAFDGRPPVGVEIVFEGQEVPIGPAAEQPAAAAQRPEDYDCDATVPPPRVGGGEPAAALIELRGAVLAEARFLEHYAAGFARVSR
jgi:hypothetical protein